MASTPSHSSPLPALLAEHLDLVYAAALRQTHDPHLAEDITQSVFLLAVRKHQSIPPNHAAAWLIKVTRYIALTTLRAHRRRRLHEQRAASEAPAMTTPPTHDPALDAHLDAALAALSHSDRELLLRRYFQNHPVAHIAASLRLTPNTTTRRLDRALQKLRRHLAHRGLTDATLSTLPTTLLATSLPKAPLLLAPKILAASATGTLTTLPLGVLLMTLLTKTTITWAVVLLLIATASGAYITTRPPRSPTAPITLPIAAPSVTGNDTGYTSLTGTVKDPAGNPLPNILVTQGDPPQLSNGYFSVHTDADGQFTFPRIKIGTDLTLAVHASGFSPDLITGTVTADPLTFTFSLKPAHTLRLRLLDARGNPLPNFALDPFFWRNTQTLRLYSFRGKIWIGLLSNANGLVTWTDAPADAVTFDPAGQYYPNRQAAAARAFLDKPFTVTATGQLQTVTIRDPIHVTLLVTDAQTHRPIPDFSITYGDGEKNTPVYWKTDRPQSGTNGEYHTAITSSSSPTIHFYKVEAPGYPSVIQSITDDQQNVTLHYRLSKQSGVSIAVVRPDGTPAAGAAVYTLSSDQNFSFQDSEMFHDPRYANGNQEIHFTDDAGKLLVTDPADPATRLVILHDAGFAELLLSDAAKSPIHLDPWASVEGTAHVGHDPFANQTITLDYAPDEPRPPYIIGTFTTTTDAHGHFSFDQVPPRHAVIGRWLEINSGTPYALGTIAHPLNISLSPGPRHIDIGGTGSLITGRILNPDHSPLHAGISSMGHIFTSISAVFPSIPATLLQESKAIYKLPPDQMKAETLKLQSSPEFVEYQRQIDEYNTAVRQVTAIYFAIPSDGSFHIDDVPPGTYTLTTTIIDLHNNKPLGTLQKSITVSASNDPLPLGDLPLTPPKSTP